MDESSFTGSGKGRAATVNRFGGLLVGEPLFQEHRLNSYAGFHENASGLQPRKDRSMTEKQARKSSDRARSQKMTDGSTPAERYAIRRHLEGSRECVSQMEEAAAGDSPMAIATAGCALRQHLRELWRLRKAREDEWAEVLNFLQTALSREPFEKLTVEQCKIVGRVIEDHLALGAVSDDQPTNVRQLLREAGFDPWKGISQPEVGT
jgi:hypothetical protein